MLRPDDPSMINNYWRNYNGEECGEQTQLGQMWLVDHINKKFKDVKFFFSVWCPPVVWKSNGKLNGGNLKADYYEDYAKYLMDQGMNIGILEMILARSMWICYYCRN